MAKIVGKGTTFSISTGGSYTAVGQVRDISTSGAEALTYDATTLDESGAGRITASTGYSSGGTVNISGLYDPSLAIHQEITDRITTPENGSYRLTFSDSSTQDFSAVGISWDTSAGMEDGLTFSASFTINGLPVFTT